MFGRAPSSRSFHDEERMFAAILAEIVQAQFDRKNAVSPHGLPQAGFTSLARLRTWKITQLPLPAMVAGHSAAVYKYRTGFVSS